MQSNYGKLGNWPYSLKKGDNNIRYQNYLDILPRFLFFKSLSRACE